MGTRAPEDDDRFAELFERALTLPEAGRLAFLRGACDDDSRLLSELTDLLDAHAAAPDYLERLGDEVLHPALDALGSSADPVDETIGHYEIRDRIGGGGMGEVFRAYDRALGRDVALKFLPAHLASDEVAIERLRQEARVASALDHPHIAVVYEIGTAPARASELGARTYIAMAYCGDRTLADEIAREGPLHLGRALACSMQLVDALSSAHGAGIVHHDVKPANLIVTERGALKLVDFGVATRSDGSHTSRERGGTPAYMSPEQISGDPVDHRSDIWSAGVVLYEMLTGSRPFTGASAEEVARAVLDAKPPSVRSTRLDVPPHLAEIIERCLAAEPRRRYASAASLLTDLRTVSDAAEGTRGSSLVVLPFERNQGDSSAEFLCDGFVDELISEFTRVRGLRVIAGASTRRLKGVERSAARIAADLGVLHALEGKFALEGDLLRLTSSLVDAQSGDQVWSVTLDGHSGELTKMCRDISREVVECLGLSTLARPDRRASAAISDPRAFEAYLRARYEAWRFSEEGFERARRYITIALELVGDHDLLYGALGHITAMQVESGLATSPDACEDVRRLADRVASLNPTSPQAHWLRAWAAFRRGDLRAAIQSGEHAHALEPDHPDVLLMLGYAYAHAGRNADGHALLLRAAQLDPLTPLTRAVQGFIPILEGRFDEAVRAYERAHEMDPDSPFFATFHGWALAYGNRHAEAVEVLLGVAERFPNTVFTAYARSLALALSSRREEALAAITPAFLGAAQENEMFARELAHCYALCGENTAALDWLERAVDLGMWNHDFLARHDTFLDGLRREPRFDELLRRVEALSAS